MREGVLRHIGLFLCICIAVLLPGLTMAQALEFDTRKFLVGVTNVDLRVSLSARPENRCGLSESSLRAATVQIFAPSGLQINREASWTIDIDVVTIKAGGVCVSAIGARSQIYGLTRSFAGTETREIQSYSIINTDLRVNSSGENDHQSRIIGEVKSISQEFLSTWLEVNSGTPLVSRAPRQSGAGTALEDVLIAQRALQRLGLYSGQIDGALGPSTRNGITQFQKQNGISPNGELNEATMLLLRARQ